MKALIQRRVGREADTRLAGSVRAGAGIDRAAATSHHSHGARNGQLGGMR